MAFAAPHVLMSEFHYDLPDELIARHPAVPRGSSRLLRIPETPSEALADSSFNLLGAALPPRAHLVLNESRVFAARLFAGLAPGSDATRTDPVEVMFLSPEAPVEDPARALAGLATGQVWRVMIRRCFDVGSTLSLCLPTEAGVRGTADLLRITSAHSEWEEEGEAPGMEASVRFEPANSAIILAALFELYGEVPLPPYLRRKTEPIDATAYQTVFASEEATGSVAAPTAGLHFSPELLAELHTGDVTSSRVVLHVSAGTFRPVTVADVADHAMHRELFEATPAGLRSIADAIDAGRPIVPVGTTAMRTIESLYWLGADLALRAAAAAGGGDRSCVPRHTLGQWDAYSEGAGGSGPLRVHPAAALRALADATDAASARAFCGSTSMCIVPGYRFAVASGLVTNLHQPDSTLLLLVAAALGSAERLRAVYAHAVAQRYRFLSYGDACILVIASAARALPATATSKGASS